jgi:hypothetical protein
VAVDEERVGRDCVVSTAGAGVDLDGAGVVDLSGPGDRSGPELIFAGLAVFLSPLRADLLCLPTNPQLALWAALCRRSAASRSGSRRSADPRIKPSNCPGRDLRAACVWLLYNPR